MNRTNSKRAGAASGFSYLRHIAVSRRLFAAPAVDLTTLVIAQEIKRRAQAERQREALRDTAYQYDMPVSQDRDRERGAPAQPADSNDFDA